MRVHSTVYRHPKPDPATVKICDQEWTTQNLDVLTYRNGDVIQQVRDPKVWSELKTGAWCWYNNDSASYAATYGRLYNWYAVNDPRGLAPRGWHVPGELEWTHLDSCLGSDSVGYKLRGLGWPVSATAADNSSGFNGLPGGFRSGGGTFDRLGNSAIFWTSDEGSALDAWCFRLLHHVNIEGEQLMITGVGYMSKSEGYSVRCVRDTAGTRDR